MTFKGYLFAAVDFLFGIQGPFVGSFSQKGVYILETLNDYQKLFRRIQRIPENIRQKIQKLKSGVKQGITYSHHSFRGIDKLFARIQVAPEESDFYHHFKAMH